MCARLCTDVLSARFNHLWPSGIAHRPEAPREMCSACRERRGGRGGDVGRNGNVPIAPDVEFSDEIRNPQENGDRRTAEGEAVRAARTERRVKR